MNKFYTVFTLLNDVDIIKQFVEKVAKCQGDVDIKSADERYVVDAKSIMGIFSLDLSRPVCIVFHEEVDYNLMFDFMNSFFPAITERREI